MFSETPFDDVMSEINKVYDDKLDDHGLLKSIDLDFKLKVPEFLYERFKLCGGTALLKRLINSIESLLKSIIDAAGIGGAIYELKDSLKMSIEED